MPGKWVRHDAARFLKPGTKLEDVYPALALKYNPDQPRVPAGNGRESGQWSSGESSSGRPRVYITTSRQEDAPGDGGDGSDLSISNPMGTMDFGSIGAEIEKLNLFGTFTRELLRGLVRLAGDPPRGIGDNGGPPLGEPPEIPKRMPATSALRTVVIRAAATWMGVAVGLNVSIIALQKILDETDWAKDRRAEAETYRDPPQSLDELQEAVSTPRAGTEIHHIAEQTALKRLGFSRSQIDARENRVRIPTLKHYDITAWYRRPNPDYGGMTPRQYLTDKPLSERMRVGRDALVLFKVMKP